MSKAVTAGVHLLTTGQLTRLFDACPAPAAVLTTPAIFRPKLLLTGNYTVHVSLQVGAVHPDQKEMCLWDTNLLTKHDGLDPT